MNLVSKIIDMQQSMVSMKHEDVPSVSLSEESCSAGFKICRVPTALTVTGRALAGPCSRSAALNLPVLCDTVWQRCQK